MAIQTGYAQEVPTMPAKLSNLYGEYHEACCRLAALRKEVKDVEQRVSELGKEWRELARVADNEIEFIINPPQEINAAMR